jgi:hypothetical protein
MAILNYIPGTLERSVKRYGATTRVNGIAQRPTPTTIKVGVADEPAEGAVVATLPEGDRTKSVRTLFTTTALQVANPATGSGDVVTLDDGEYEIRRVEDFPTRDTIPGAAHYEYTAVRLGDLERR